MSTRKISFPVKATQFSLRPRIVQLEVPVTVAKEKRRMEIYDFKKLQTSQNDVLDYAVGNN